MSEWSAISGGYRRAGSTCNGKQYCHIVGGRAAHSHYAWASDMFWARYGDMYGQ